MEEVLGGVCSSEVMVKTPSLQKHQGHLAPRLVSALQVTWDNLGMVLSHRGHERFGKIPNIL